MSIHTFAYGTPGSETYVAVGAYRACGEDCNPLEDWLSTSGMARSHETSLDEGNIILINGDRLPYNVSFADFGDATLLIVRGPMMERVRSIIDGIMGCEGITPEDISGEKADELNRIYSGEEFT